MKTKLPDLQISGRGDTLGEQVYTRLRSALLSGLLKPGQKLSVRALATSLNVSLTPTRDALARLIAEDILKQGPNRTVFVPVLEIHEIEEVFNLRCLLETDLAERALEHAPDTLVVSLKKIQDLLIRAFDRHDYKSVVARNFEFHFAIYETRNSIISLKMVENLWLRAGPMMNLLYPEFDRTRTGVKNHAAILDAIEKRDISKIAESIEKDILGAKKN